MGIGPDYTRSQVARASAVTTTGEVAGNAWSTSNADNGALTVDVTVTISAAETVTVRFYGSADHSNYYAISEEYTGTSEAITATTHKFYHFSAMPGLKSFRISVQGSGTNSTVAATYRWHTRGSQR